jgi:hypothetical protein
MTLFDRLFGFAETSGDDVRAKLIHNGDTLTSTVNGATYRCGHLTTPSLGELRGAAPSGGRLTVREVVGDVQTLHADPANAGALFQVASQFNLLEMVSPSHTPEEGVSIYEYDRTQGPACAIACAAGTVFRNWFAPVGDQIGQSSNTQLDMAADLHKTFGGDAWQMRNGYLLPHPGALASMRQTIDSSDREQLIDTVRIGIQHDTEVTLPGAGHLVSQAYCSAVPVAYTSERVADWEPLARLVLDAAYEATMWTAVDNAHRTGNNTVFLTLLGGGAFGNPTSWITDAMVRSFDLFGAADLDVAIVSYGASHDHVKALER